MSGSEAPRDSPEADARLPPAAYERMTLVLRAGLIGSLVILVATILVYLAGQPSVTSQGIIGSNPSLQYLTIGGLASGLAAGSPIAYLIVGILVLVATPVVRVLSGLYYFALGGERTMAVLTFTVFALLLVGLLVVGPLVR